MKKCLIALLFSAAWICFAGVPEPKSLYDLQNAACTPDKLQSVRSAKLIYEVKAGDGYYCMIIRAAGKDRVRMDLVGEKEIYSVCRNGNEYWVYEKGTGLTDLPEKDQKIMQEELAYLPLPFTEKPEIFLPLTADGKGVCGNDAIKCRCYKTGLTRSPKDEIALWVEESTGLLCQVKAQCEEGLYATSYLRYQEFDGIQLATRINLASPQESVRMKLLSADWNIPFADTVFQRNKPDTDSSLIVIQRNMKGASAVKPVTDHAKEAARKAAQQEAAKARAKRLAEFDKKRMKRQIERQEKVVRDLEIRIAAKQKMLVTQEQVFKSDREQAAGLSHGVGSLFRRVWSAYGWSASSRGSRSRGRAARNLYRESGAIAASYEQTSRDLTDLQIRLGDAKVELEKMKEEWAKMTGEESHSWSLF